MIFIKNSINFLNKKKIDFKKICKKKVFNHFVVDETLKEFVKRKSELCRACRMMFDDCFRFSLSPFKLLCVKLCFGYHESTQYWCLRRNERWKEKPKIYPSLIFSFLQSCSFIALSRFSIFTVYVHKRDNTLYFFSIVFEMPSMIQFSHDYWRDKLMIFCNFYAI